MVDRRRLDKVSFAARLDDRLLSSRLHRDRFPSDPPKDGFYRGAEGTLLSAFSPKNLS